MRYEEMAGLAGVAAMVRTSRLGNDSSCTGGSREHPWRRLVPTCGLLLSGRCSSVALGSCKLCPGAARLECCAARGRAEATGSKVGGRSAAARAGVAAADVPSASRFISPAAACLVRGFGCGERRGGACRLVEVKPQQRMPVCLLGGGRGAGWCWWECWSDRRGCKRALALWMWSLACLLSMRCSGSLAAATPPGEPIQTPIADTHCRTATKSSTQQ